MKYYNRLDSVYVTVLHETYTLSTDTWAAADADTGYPKITITDPAGTVKVSAVGMTKRATGKYEYLYELTSTDVLGTWIIFILTENGGYSDKVYRSFGVRK